MGLARNIGRLTNRLIRPCGISLVRWTPQQGRRIFPRGDFFDVLQKRVPPSAVGIVLDVGAYDGGTATRFCDLYPGASVHAFEPTPASFAELSDCAALRSDGRLVAHQLAMSAQVGKGRLHCHAAPQTNSLRAAHPAAERQWPDGRFAPLPAVDVQIDTIDAFCARERIERVDILKVDAQGEDLRILHGAQAMLQARRIGAVVIELYFVPVYQEQGEPLQIVDHLQRAGFGTAVYLCHDVDRDGRLLCADAVFILES